jgi:hypothetical protein
VVEEAGVVEEARVVAGVEAVAVAVVAVEAIADISPILNSEKTRAAQTARVFRSAADPAGSADVSDEPFAGVHFAG